MYSSDVLSTPLLGSNDLSQAAVSCLCQSWCWRKKKKHKSLGANESAFSAAFISGLTLPYQIKFH